MNNPPFLRCAPAAVGLCHSSTRVECPPRRHRNNQPSPDNKLLRPTYENVVFPSTKAAPNCDHPQPKLCIRKLQCRNLSSASLSLSGCHGHWRYGLVPVRSLPPPPLPFRTQTPVTPPLYSSVPIELTSFLSESTQFSRSSVIEPVAIPACRLSAVLPSAPACPSRSALHEVQGYSYTYDHNKSTMVVSGTCLDLLLPAIIMLATLTPAVTAATTYKVTPNGKWTSSSGYSSSSKIYSLPGALAIAKAGDTILLADGTYTDRLESYRDGKSSSPIKIKGGEGAKIKAGSPSVHIRHSWILLQVSVASVCIHWVRALGSGSPIGYPGWSYCWRCF